MKHKIAVATSLVAAALVAFGAHAVDGRKWDTAGIRRPDDAPVATKTAAYTVVAADHSRLILINAAASKTMTLPEASTVPGMIVTFSLVVATTSGNGHLIDVADSTDRVRGAGITDAAGKGIECTQATDRVGDSITLVSDGADVWYVVDVVGTWAVET